MYIEHTIVSQRIMKKKEMCHCIKSVCLLQRVLTKSHRQVFEGGKRKRLQRNEQDYMEKIMNITIKRRRV